MRETFHYRLFGLTLCSALELPELEPCDAGGGDAIQIERGDVPPHANATRKPVMTPAGALLAVKATARFLVSDGRRILVDADPAASARDVRLFLLGSAMGVLLHQRGLLPLHANAVEFAGRAIAFMGHSGAGKSTLAAAFHDRGGRILSDDVCVLTPDRETYLVQPGIPRLRLWRDAIERSGRSVGAYERASDAVDKYIVGTHRAAHATALPLGAIYLLRQGAADAEFTVRRLSGVDAAQALIENTYRGAYIQIVGDPAAFFQICLAVSRAAPVFELVRPWNTARFDETFNRIEAHLAATSS